ncbi:hypothetical protein HPB47_000926 [Ixodes persulcatus]|uniref:Uncharacterized protein n=1 Tax=Ixodes persulcatus TaxID=34615 RepID=A0AC60PRW2_IXOPE|nr:hypothetical protein HPB47_000926 [Ixodes persulcatus]
MDTIAPKEISPPKASGVVSLAPAEDPKKAEAARALPIHASTSSRKSGQLDEAHSPTTQQSQADEVMDESMPPSDDALLPSGPQVIEKQVGPATYQFSDERKWNAKKLTPAPLQDQWYQLHHSCLPWIQGLVNHTNNLKLDTKHRLSFLGVLSGNGDFQED